MGYAYVKKLKQGELAEGENPMHVIRVSDATLDVFLHPVQEGDAPWELADKSEWDGELTHEEKSMEEEVVAAEEVAEVVEEKVEEEVAEVAEVAEAESVDETKTEEVA